MIIIEYNHIKELKKNQSHIWELDVFAMVDSKERRQQSLSLIRILKALGDETRLSIVNVLRTEKLCVCEIEAILQSSQSNVSRHLAKLRDAGIIYSEKKSQWVYYGINMDTLAKYSFIKTLLDEDLANHPEYQEELVKLKKYREEYHECQLP